MKGEYDKLVAENEKLKEQVLDLTNGNYKRGIHTWENLNKMLKKANEDIQWWTDKDFEDFAKVKDLQQRLDKAVEILKDSEHKAPTCRVIKALEVLEATPLNTSQGQELHDQTIRLQKDLEASQRYIDALEKPSHDCNGQQNISMGGTVTRGCWNCNNQPTQTGGVCPYRNEKQAFAFCCIYWQERSKNI